MARLWTREPRELLDSELPLWPQAGLEREQLCNCYARLVIVMAVVLILVGLVMPGLVLGVLGLLVVALIGYWMCEAEPAPRVEHYRAPSSSSTPKKEAAPVRRLRRGSRY